jgi:parallel beta-helix repeat protein
MRGGLAVAAAVALLAWSGAPRPARAQVACGETVTASVKLTADLACTGPGLVVGADKITIDLGGFTLSGDGDPGDVGVDNQGFDSVTLKNGTITEFGEGVSIGGDAQKNTLSDLTVTNCSSDAIDLNDADLAKVTGVTLIGSAGDGVVMSGDAVGNRVEKSAIVANGGLGMFVVGTDHVISKNEIAVNVIGLLVGGSGTSVSANELYRNGSDGVQVTGEAIELVKNTAIGNGGEGFFVDGPAAVLEKNEASGSGQNGIRVAVDSDDAVLRKNTVRGNELDGILIEVDCDRAVLERNTATGNHTDGIQTENTSSTLTRNEANANGELGIEAAGGAFDGGGNQAENNADGGCVGVVCD